MWVVALAPLGMVFWLSSRLHAMSLTKAKTLFYVFVAMGVSLSSILVVYDGSSVARAFFVTAGAFAGLSLYGYTTKRDLGPMGAFMVIGLFGLILAMLVNMFVGSQGLEFYLDRWCADLCRVTAWDTQKIKLMYMASAVMIWPSVNPSMVHWRCISTSSTCS